MHHSKRKYIPYKSLALSAPQALEMLGPGAEVTAISRLEPVGSFVVRCSGRGVLFSEDQPEGYLNRLRLN